MKYAYIRVSTKEQNLARQVEAIRLYAPDLPDSAIFSDKQSGKNLKRTEYQRLNTLLRSGDELIVKELDRLGRNKQNVKDEYIRLTNIGVIVRVLELPTTLIDFQGQDWVREMINNLMLEVLATMAEQERNKILRRQREGLEAMPVINGKRISIKTGRAIGRPCKNINYELMPGESVSAACLRLGISRTQWYRKQRHII